MWSWESFFGSMVGCIIGWTVIPAIARWVKGEGGVKNSPDDQKSASRNDKEERGVQLAITFGGSLDALGKLLSSDLPATGDTRPEAPEK